MIAFFVIAQGIVFLYMNDYSYVILQKFGTKNAQYQQQI